MNANNFFSFMLTDDEEEEVDEDDDEGVHDVPSPISVIMRDKVGSKKMPLKKQLVRRFEVHNWREESMDQEN